MRNFAIGVGLVGVIAGTGFGQALPAGYEPLPGAPGRIAPPAGGLLPPGYTAVPPTGEPRPYVPPPLPIAEIRTAIPADHAWLLKPEHGEYFISVKSYSRPSRPTADDHGPSALALAEALAGEIRDQYRVQAFVYEYVSEERKAEMAALIAARERSRTFMDQMGKQKQTAELQGMSFLEPDTKIRFKTVNYRDQIAVLIGGFKTDEDARKAIDKVRAWPAPLTKVKDGMQRETSLMDYGSVIRPGPDGKPQLQQSFINPYQTSTVVLNPSIQRASALGAATELDPFIVKLNEGRPFNLLTSTKTWTLGVKSFTAPVEIIGKDGGNSTMKKFGMSKGGDVLAAGAEQAETLAKALRDMKTDTGHSLGLEAFVLHTRNASLVTVGQFDSPNDPAMLQVKQLLSGTKMIVSEDRLGQKPVANAQSIFGNLIPMPIPRK